MLPTILVFLSLVILIYFGIQAAKKITGNQLLFLTKTFAYVTISVVLAIVLLTTIVILF
jgi:hypothetical protein